MDLIRFRIDPNQVNPLKKKVVKRTLKNMIPVMAFSLIIFSIYIAFSNSPDIIPFFIGLFLFPPIPLWIGIKMGIRNLLSLQIELSENGVLRIMQNSPFVTIPWESLSIDYSKDGDILLLDKKVSNFKRAFNGLGKIWVPSELEGFVQFKLMVDKMIQS